MMDILYNAKPTTKPSRAPLVTAASPSIIGVRWPISHLARGRLWAVVIESWLMTQKVVSPEVSRVVAALRKHEAKLITDAHQIAHAAEWFRRMRGWVAERWGGHELGAVIAWAAVTAWTEAHEAEGLGMWSQLASGLEPLAKNLERECGREVSGEAVECAAMAARIAEEVWR